MARGKMLQSIYRWATSQRAMRVAVLSIVSAVTTIAYLAIPLKVTVDGVNYIASAKALLTNDMANMYVWYREPGYPLFLKFVHNLGDSGSLLVFSQSLLLGFASAISFYTVRRAAGYSQASLIQIAIAIALVANPMFLIYAGLVLQQALFAFLLALFSLFVLWAFQRPLWLRTGAFTSLILFSYLASVLTSVGWIYLGFFPVLISLTKIFWLPISKFLTRKSWGAAKTLRIAVAVVLTALIAVASYFVGTKTYAAWEDYKDHTMRTDYAMPNVIKPLTSTPYIPPPDVLASRMLSIMHIGLQENYIYENKLFLDQQMRRIWPLPEWDSAYVSLPYSQYAEGYIALTNPSKIAHTAMSYTAPFASNVYRAIFVSSLITLLVAAIRKKWLLGTILLVAWSFIFVYAASNSPIDRYGVPAFPFAAASIGLLLSWLGEGFSRMKSLRKSH